MNRSLLFFFLLLTGWSAVAQGAETAFSFTFEGHQLHGVINQPEPLSNVSADGVKGMVLIIHGSGQTNAVAQQWHQDVRATLNQAGFATFMWDKPGCGKSEGTFDYNQTVKNSAQEAIAAIQTLQSEQVPGSETIGLWGISRAGWVCPIIINQYADIQFWISVSGVDSHESFGYLLENNLRINGLPADRVQLLVKEWKAGNRVTHSGGSYEKYLSATQNLRANPFMNRWSNQDITEADYYTFQTFYQTQAFDYTTDLQVYVPDFDAILQKVNCPVLAIFGEKDRHVDWQKTKALYERTLGQQTDLSIHTFPDGNHNLFQCQTGGFFEFQDDRLPWIRSEGFLATLFQWVDQQ